MKPDTLAIDGQVQSSRKMLILVENKTQSVNKYRQFLEKVVKHNFQLSFHFTKCTRNILVLNK